LPRRFVVSGCSGGGKSTLIDALAAGGVAVVPEPGLRIVRGGGPMPWDDPAGFARAALALARQDWDWTADLPGPVFFDRGLVDAVAALQHATGETAPEALGLGARYDPLVFLAPPWPAIYAQDAERRHGFDTALDEYARLAAFYPVLGYRVVDLPRAPVAARVAFVRAHLDA